MAEKVWTWTSAGWSATGASDGSLATQVEDLLAKQTAQGVSVAALEDRVEAVETSIGPAISNALSNYVSSAALTGLLANVFHVVGYGTGWPSSRPAAAGTRPVFAYGGPAAPTWLSTANRDLWVGTV